MTVELRQTPVGRYISILVGTQVEGYSAHIVAVLCHMRIADCAVVLPHSFVKSLHCKRLLIATDVLIRFHVGGHRYINNSLIGPYHRQ